MVDASVVVRALLGVSTEAAQALKDIRWRLAPDIIYSETTNALVGYCRAGSIDWTEGAALIRDALMLRIRVSSARILAPTAFDLARERGLSAYDASYVALAEKARVTLVTADRRLAAAYGRSELIA